MWLRLSQLCMNEGVGRVQEVAGSFAVAVPLFVCMGLALAVGVVCLAFL